MQDLHRTEQSGHRYKYYGSSQKIVGKEHKYWWNGTARAPAVDTPIEPPNETIPMEKAFSSGSD